MWNLLVKKIKRFKIALIISFILLLFYRPAKIILCIWQVGNRIFPFFLIKRRKTWFLLVKYFFTLLKYFFSLLKCFFYTAEIFLAINSIRKKKLEYKAFNQVIENLLLSGTIFTKTDPEYFYSSNDDIIIESFNDITLLRQDINEKQKIKCETLTILWRFCRKSLN